MTCQLETGEIPRSIEVVRSDFPVFKDAISQRIEGLEQERERESLDESPSVEQDTVEAAAVYLIYDKCDRADQHRRDLVTFLGAEELEVLTPLPGGGGVEISQILEEHRRKLKESDGVIVFSGGSGPAWLDTQKRDVMKQCSRKDQQVCFYLGPPRTDYKEFDFVAPAKAKLVRNESEFEAGLLRDFVESVRKTKGS